MEDDNDLGLPFEKLNVSNSYVKTAVLKDKKHNDDVNNNVKPDKVKTLEEVDESINNNKTCKTLQKSSCLCSNTLSLDDVEELAHTFCSRKKKIHKSKSVIRKAKLILPIDFQSHKKEKKLLDDDLDFPNKDNDKTTCDQDQTCIENNQSNSTTSTCGSQYMNSYYVNNNGISIPEEQTQFNPNELASYFEQILYIPKPMSLMAEMMYA